ncbi:MAG: hypothetical protein ACK5RL_17255 [Acidimicrobiales bacterium]
MQPGPPADGYSTPPLPNIEVARFAAARDAILGHAPSHLTGATLADIERSLSEALSQRDRVAAAVRQLDPTGVAADLKAALRGRPDQTAPDTPKIEALRRRYEAVAGLQNQLDGLGDRIEVLLADVETAAVVAVTATVDGDTASGLGSSLATLRDDMVAVDEARRALRSA